MKKYNITTEFKETKDAYNHSLIESYTEIKESDIGSILVDILDCPFKLDENRNKIAVRPEETSFVEKCERFGIECSDDFVKQNMDGMNASYDVYVDITNCISKDEFTNGSWKFNDTTYTISMTKEN